MSRCPDCNWNDCICDEISPEGVRRRVGELEDQVAALTERLSKLEERLEKDPE